MQIQGSTVLVLGGAGLVGEAVCHRLLVECPSQLIIAASRKASAERAAKAIAAEAPQETQVKICWGNIFVRWELRERSWEDILADPGARQAVLADLLDVMAGDRRREILAESTLARMIAEFRPDAVVDCINTATALAYQNVYRSASELRTAAAGDASGFQEAVERHLVKMYTPQLVRHMQILHEALHPQPGEGRPNVQAYVKVGTTGSGGMGFNMPYTHGEEKPSAMLLSKSAMAGAHSLMLFLLARTPPNAPAVKEVKPAAAIGWAGVGHGPIAIKGRRIALYDCPPDAGYDLPSAAVRQGDFGARVEGRDLENVYIDTGENGLYALGEFEVLTALGQMEFVTAEEVAEAVVRELKGAGTGFDMISALDQAVMGPSYRAAYLRPAALARLRRLEQERQVRSVAFEALGPPMVSKLLFEAELLRRIGGVALLCSKTPEELAAACAAEVVRDVALRRQMISIGVPILTRDGRRLLRGPLIKADRPEDGWVDLRPENMAVWQARLEELRKTAEQERLQDAGRRSSGWDQIFVDPASGELCDDLEIGDVVAWILETEQGGARMKR